MKRKTLTTAIVAGVAGVAGIANISSAVNINPDGLGEVLIYPYYTANGGNDTLISVVNTTDEVKAVKVRFLDSKNSLEVLDFNLYLSPFDVWTGAVTSTDEAGPGVLTTNDTSCTVPSLFDQRDGTLPNGAPFVAFRTLSFLFERFISTGAVIDADPIRTREGHIEMIEMGVVNNVSSSFAPASAATHRAGTPADCGTLVAAWAPGGEYSQDPQAGMEEPNGGLFGGGSIINVSEGYQASYNADAVDGFYNPAGALLAAAPSLHAEPGDTLPDLTQAATGDIADPVTSNVFDNARVVTSDWDNTFAVDAVSAVFMRNAIFNEYAIDTVLNGASEWVVTFPTKRYYVNGSTAAIPPFTNLFRDNGSACEEVGIRFWNREEQTTVGGVNFSPSLSITPTLCWEAQVVSFGQSGAPSEIFGSPLSQNIAVDSAGFENGWARLAFDTDARHTYTSVDGDVYNGLPVTGFSYVVVQNGTLTDASGNNVLSNYAGLFAHRASRSIIGS